MSLIGQNFDQLKRDLFTQAALTPTGGSRVPADVIRDGLDKALVGKDLSLAVQKSGAIGVHVPVKILVTNDAGDSFVLAGQVLLQIPETRKSRESGVEGAVSVSVVPSEPEPSSALVHVSQTA